MEFGIYINDAKKYCEIYIKKIKQLNSFISEIEKHHQDIFCVIRELITYASLVTKIFWPTDKNSKSKQSRGIMLRKLLGINNSRAIVSRKLRNHFEHYDERIDLWRRKSKFKCIIIDMIGSRDQIGGNSVNDENIITLFDPKTNIFSFMGQQYNLQEITDDIVSIYQKIKLYNNKTNLTGFPPPRE